MKGAFKSFASALGVSTSCYLLAIASWQQVLIFFFVASWGWCAWSCYIERKKAIITANYVPKKIRHVEMKSSEPLGSLSYKPLSKQSTTPPSNKLAAHNKIQPRVYRFPIQKLAHYS